MIDTHKFKEKKGIGRTTCLENSGQREVHPSDGCFPKARIGSWATAAIKEVAKGEDV